MKLYARLLVILGGSALGAFLIFAMIGFAGISEHRKFISGNVADLQDNFLKYSTQSVVLGDSAFLESEFNSYFSVLELILSKEDSKVQALEYFSVFQPEEVDYVLVDRKGETLCIGNPGRKNSRPVISSDEYETFLHQIRRSAGSRKRCIFAAELCPGVLWVTLSDHGSDSIAVFRINGSALLNRMPAVNGDSATALVWEKGFIATNNTAGTPASVITRMESACNAAEHKHSSRLITGTSMQDETGKSWSIISAHLFPRSEVSSGLHVIHALRPPESVSHQAAEIHDSFTGISILLAAALILAILLFLPVLLTVARHLSSQIGQSVSFVREVFQASSRPRNLSLKYSSEMEELSSVLNLLRDKLSSALNRLSRSHERELRVKKDAEESNILRSELLSSVLAEVRDPLSRIDGFSKVIRRKGDSDGEIVYAAEQIRLENRAMISVFRALSDLTGLDSMSRELGAYQIEPSDIIRDALNDLTQRAAKHNISLEIQNVAKVEEPLMTSPSVLTHTVYTAAATLIRFIPENTKLKISSFMRGNALVFHFSDQPSDHISIAEVFREYTESGTISEPHCTVAVLNLLILKSEAEYLGAQVTIEKNETANSMIEISLPVIAFNPAVTGVFTRPKLMADPDRVSTEARFHVAGIACVSLSGRAPFQSADSAGSVLLANLQEPDTSLYRMVFSGEGFAVSSAENSRDCFRYIKNNRFDLIFLDMTSELEDHFSLVSRIRKSVPASSVLIILTESRNLEYVEKLLNTGADYCFRKPVVMDDLLFAIHKLKSGRRDFL